MLALRYLYLLSLTPWLGGMIVLGAVVAPALFGTLETSNILNGRELAGATFGEIVRRFYPVAYTCAILMLTSLIAQMILIPRLTKTYLKVGLVLIMLLSNIYAGIEIFPEMENLRQEFLLSTTNSIQQNPGQIRFNILHKISSAIMMLNIVGGLILTFLETHDSELRDKLRSS